MARSTGAGPRGNPFQLGIVLLIYNVMAKFGLTNIPPVTLSLVGLQTALFLGYLDPGWGSQANVALNANRILHYGEYQRLIFSHLEHASDLHLYYNCLSLLYKGLALERRLGAVRFFLLVVLFGVTGGMMYVGLASAAADVFRDGSYLRESAVGFSLILFALKVVVNYYDSYPGETTNQFGFDIPRRMAIWTELIIIQILVPRASFLGHLAGILVGILFVHGVLPVLRFLANPRASGFQTPWVTLVLSGGMTALHLNMVTKPWSTIHFWEKPSNLVCLSSHQILVKGQFLRLLSAPLEHLGDVHFATCLLSFILKGAQLEPSRRGFRFGFTAFTTMIATSISYVVMAKFWCLSNDDNSAMFDCVQGLSATLFALKVLCVFEAETLWTPASLFELFELIILIEDSNRMWHVSGLLAGLCIHLWRDSKFPGTGIRLDGGTAPPEPGWTRSWGYASSPRAGPRTVYDQHQHQDLESCERRRQQLYNMGAPFSDDELDLTLTEDDQDNEDHYQSNSESEYSNYSRSSRSYSGSDGSHTEEEEEESQENINCSSEEGSRSSSELDLLPPLPMRMRRSVTPSLAPRSRSLPVQGKGGSRGWFFQPRPGWHDAPLPTMTTDEKFRRKKRK